MITAENLLAAAEGTPTTLEEEAAAGEGVAAAPQWVNAVPAIDAGPRAMRRAQR